MQMPSLKMTLADISPRDYTKEMIERAFPMPKSLASPSIDLAYIDTINKRSSEPLMSAIQNAESGLNAQEAERRGMVNQGMQQGYAAETNARNQLVAKSNELATAIRDLSSGHMMLDNPEFAKEQIASFMQQKAGIDAQLAKSTEAIKRNPAYGGETLVEPVEVRGANAAAQQQTEGLQIAQTPATMAANFIGDMIKSLPDNGFEQGVNNLTLNDAWNAFTEKNPDIKMSKKEFRDEMQLAKDEALGIKKNSRDISLNQSKFYNDIKEEELRKYKIDNNIAGINNVMKIMTSFGISKDSPEGLKLMGMADGVNTISAIANVAERLLKQPAIPKKELPSHLKHF